MDWAEASRILGVSEAATDAERKEQYYYKAQLLHPDKNQDRPDNIRKKAEAELAIEPMRIRFKDVSPGQRKIATLIIKNVGGPYTSVWIENQPAPWLSVTGVKSLTSERLPLEVTIECTGSGEPNQTYYCDLPVKLENENTRVVDRVSVKIELYIRSDFANWVGKDLKTAINKPAAGAAKGQSVQPPLKTKKMGFSYTAFIVDILAFAIVATISVFTVNAFFALGETILMSAITVFTTLGFGVSLNHALTAGSGEKRKNNKK
jgi:hypothetical protein